MTFARSMQESFPETVRKMELSFIKLNPSVLITFSLIHVTFDPGSKIASNSFNPFTQTFNLIRSNCFAGQ